MPQIYLGGNNSSVSIGASPLQARLTEMAVADAVDERRRGDQALNKAVAFLNKYNPTGTGNITIKDGIVNADVDLAEKMAPKSRDVSRGGRTKLSLEKTLSAEDKSKALNEVAKKRLESGNPIQESTLDNANKEAKDKGQVIPSGELGESSLKALNQMIAKNPMLNAESQSLRTGENRSASINYTGPSIGGTGDDYIVNADSQQEFDDTFGDDTKRARMLAEFEQIGALASGRDYDPSKDVYLQGAIDRDTASNQAYANDAQREAGMSNFTRGSDGSLSVGSLGVSQSVGIDADKSVRVQTNNNMGNGGGGDNTKPKLISMSSPTTDGAAAQELDFEESVENGENLLRVHKDYTLTGNEVKNDKFAEAVKQGVSGLNKHYTQNGYKVIDTNTKEKVKLLDDLQKTWAAKYGENQAVEMRSSWEKLNAQNNYLLVKDGQLTGAYYMSKHNKPVIKVYQGARAEDVAFLGGNKGYSKKNNNALSGKVTNTGD